QNPYNKTDPQSLRHQRITQLRDDLWRYAQSNGGGFPPNEFVTGLPPSAWQTTHPSGLRYIYVPGRTPDRGRQVVAYEPGAFGGKRYVLRSNGEIEAIDIGSIQGELDGEMVR